MEHLLRPIAHWIIQVISSSGYNGIALMMAIESACIPLPSEVIMPFSGALTTVAVASMFRRTPLNLYLVTLAGAGGCVLGSLIAYWVGIYGGRPLAERYGRYVLVRKRDIDRADRWFARWGVAAVFFSRLLPVIRTFISLPAGIAKMNFWQFVLYTFIGSLPWCFVLAYIGNQLGSHWSEMKGYFHRADAAIVIVIILLFAFWLYHHLKPEKEESLSDPAKF